jgi:hypothetical protein
VAGAQAPEAKVDRGGGDSITAYHFSAPGDDSQPLPGDVAFVAEDEGAGNGQIVGYQDPKTSPAAGVGEKRIYSRSGPGVVAAEVWLKADGSIDLLTGGTAIVVLGSRSDPQFVALAELVAEQLTTLKDAISNAPVVALDGGASFKSGIVTALANWPGSVAAKKVKAE